jgi:branched-chain amino acid transport system substrate-binding protein
MKAKLLLLIFPWIFTSISWAQELKVGVILPLTGNAASYGEQFKSGLELAAKNYPSTTFIFEDSKFENATALTAFRKLVDIDHINALFSFGGATCEVLNSEAQQNKLLHFAAGCNTAKFNNSDSFNFRLDVNEEIAANKTAKYLTKQDILRVALIYVDNAWAGSIINQTRAALKKHGIEIAVDIPFSENAPVDVKSSLVQLRSTKPDLIFLISLPNLTPLVLKQLNDLHIDIPIMSNISVENPEVVRLAGTLADGIIYLSVKTASQSREKFPDFYKKFPTGNPFAAWGFDSVILLYQSNKAESPRRYLHNLKDFVGAFNLYTFDENGELHLNYEIKEIKSGNYISKADI